MSTDKRTIERTKKRVMVRYGVDKLEKTAFTRNISGSGICLQTNSVYKPGTTLQLELRFGDDSFSMWGRVVWAKKVPPQLAHVLDCGMGLSFVNPPTDWFDFYTAWKSSGAKL